MTCDCLNPVTTNCKYLCAQRAALIASVRYSVGTGGGGSVNRELDMLLMDIFNSSGINFDRVPELLEALNTSGRGSIADRVTQSVEALRQIENAITDEQIDFDSLFGASEQLVASQFYGAALQLNQSLVAELDRFTEVENANAIRSRSLSLQADIYEATDKPLEALQARSLATLFVNMPGGG